MTVTDGEQLPRSSDAFTLKFAQAEVTGRDAIIDCFAALICIWRPVRGAVDGLELAKRHRNDTILYPPVGVLTYFATDGGYVLPESPRAELRQLPNGVMAVLKEWTLEAVLSYEEAFRAVNQGTPNRRLMG